MKTPDEWSVECDVVIHDPDGWRVDGKSWDEPLTLEDFNGRMMMSTISLKQFFNTDVSLDK